MKIHINGEIKNVAPGVTLPELLASLQLENQAVAIELNQQVVPRKSRYKIVLREGDQLEIVTFVGGG